MKLQNSDIDDRIKIVLNRSIKDDISTGIMSFGEKNDYPEIIEKTILGSQTGKAAFKILSKFIAGQSFVDPVIGSVIVGKDIRGNDLTLDRLRTQIASSIGMFNGVYIHCNMTATGEVVDVHLRNFKNCRLSTSDSLGYSGRIAYSSDFKNKKGTTFFNSFNPSRVLDQMKKAEQNKEKYNGQIYYSFLEDNYIYPLSLFDSVYLDMDTEFQIQLYKNREVRNGFSNKIIMVTEEPNGEDETTKLVKKCQSFMGAEGDKLLLFTAEFDENGNVRGDNFKVEKIETNIDAELFNNVEVSLSNNIRKAANGLPAVLIDYEQGTLSAASGEMLKSAVNVYNAYTLDLRNHVSEIIKEIFSHHEILKNTTNWGINPINLVIKEDVVTPLDTNKEAQAVLRGSVGGVTALLALQTSVSQGITPIDSAISIIEEIYGIPKDVAIQMMGGVKQL